MLMAEVQQAEEAFAGKYFDKKTYHKASKEYFEDMVNILGDIGMRKPTSKTNLLTEHFGLFTDFGKGSLLLNNRTKKLFKTSTLFATTNIGEHEAQSRLLLASLMKKRALDKNGNDIGSIYDFYEVNDKGRLVFDKDRRVANFSNMERVKFAQSIQALVKKLHGNY